MSDSNQTSASGSARIDELFRKLRDEGRIGLMTHIVFGYPTVKASRKIIDLMVKSGVDIIEIQLPFSDPTADGPVITHACQKALDHGVRVSEGMRFMEEVTSAHSTPFLFMTYYNIAFSYRGPDPDTPRGVAAFARASASAGAGGLIIPDVPPEATQEGYPEACREFGLHPIYVLSPNIGEKRLRAVKNVASGFLYCTSRTGTTGKDVELRMDQLGRFLDRTREIIDLPVAVGFSISKREHVAALQGKAELAVVGSHLLRVYDEQGIGGLERALRELAGKS